MTLFNEDVNNVSRLENLPNENQGLDPDSLKAVFDKAANDIKNFINNVLIPEITISVDAAARGITRLGLNGSEIVNHSITEEKYASGSVSADALKSYSVNETKLSAALKTKIDGYTTSIETLNTAMLSVGNSISSLERSLSTLSDSITSQLSLKQAKHKTLTCTLESGVTTWTVTATGVTATNTVFVSIDPSQNNDWGIKCTAQGADSLTFTAYNAPDVDITMNVAIFD